MSKFKHRRFFSNFYYQKVKLEDGCYIWVEDGEDFDAVGVYHRVEGGPDNGLSFHIADFDTVLEAKSFIGFLVLGGFTCVNY
jgi:hypothetical protein